jgi:hypothetical protein
VREIPQDGELLRVRKTVWWLAILFGVLVVGYVMYSSFSPKAYRVRVCMGYKGGTNCGTASADKREVALREATTNACALIASGITESGQCENSNPVSVDWR